MQENRRDGRVKRMEGLGKQPVERCAQDPLCKQP